MHGINRGGKRGGEGTDDGGRLNAKVKWGSEMTKSGDERTRDGDGRNR